MRTKELRERLLVAFYLAAKSNGLTAYYEPAEIADAFDLPRSPGQLRLIVDDIQARGFIDTNKTLGGGDERGMHIRFLNSGIEEAESLIEEHPEYEMSGSSDLAPASNRYVAISDNQRGDIQDELSDLRETLRADNSADPVEREIALSEIAIFEAAVIQPRVSTELIERFARRIAVWIARAFTAAAVGVIVKSLIEKLWALLPPL